MGKFVRQSVYEWKQFRNDIKKKNYMYEGKEFTGWDLPMHEQIRLYRIAEARIVEVANYANMADAPVAAPAAAGGKSLYKKSLSGVFQAVEFVFATASLTAVTGAHAAAGNARANSFSGHFIDLSTGWTGPNTGDRRFRISYESSSAISAGTTAGTIGGAIQFEATAALDLSTGSAAAGGVNTTHSMYVILRDSINNDSVPVNGTGFGTKVSTYFSASVDSGSSVGGGRLLITATHAGAISAPNTSFGATTASVNIVTSGQDVLCGPDGATWSTYKFGKKAFENTVRLKA